MADTTLPKAMETLAVSSKTKELRGTEKRDTLIEIEKVRLPPETNTPIRRLWELG